MWNLAQFRCMVGAPSPTLLHTLLACHLFRGCLFIQCQLVLSVGERKLSETKADYEITIGLSRKYMYMHFDRF